MSTWGISGRRVREGREGMLPEEGLRTTAAMVHVNPLYRGHPDDQQLIAGLPDPYLQTRPFTGFHLRSL